MNTFDDLHNVLHLPILTEGFFRRFAESIEGRTVKTITIGDKEFFMDADEERISHRPRSQWRQLTLDEKMILLETHDATHEGFVSYVHAQIEGYHQYVANIPFIPYVNEVVKMLHDLVGNDHSSNVFNITGCMGHDLFGTAFTNMANWRNECIGCGDFETVIPDTGFVVRMFRDVLTVFDKENMLTLTLDTEGRFYIETEHGIPSVIRRSKHYDYASYTFGITNIKPEAYRVSYHDSSHAVYMVTQIMKFLQKIGSMSESISESTPVRNDIVIFDGAFVSNNITLNQLISHRLDKRYVIESTPVTAESLIKCLDETVVIVGTSVPDHLLTVITRLAKEVIVL